MKKIWILGLLLACSGSDAEELGIAGECAVDDDCPVVNWAADGAEEETQLECLTQFAAGYCGLSPCSNGSECPTGSICVAHDDGSNYCFLACDDKPECNFNRGVENEANCAANFDWADPADDDGRKACIPPSSGI